MMIKYPFNIYYPHLVLESTCNVETGSQMLAAAGDVFDQLHKLYSDVGSGVGFQVRQELKIFKNEGKH